jgi:hypothetical protein
MPDAPVQIIANASSSAPAAPVQIAANGAGSSPTAPPVVSFDSSADRELVTVGGTTTPDATGVLGEVFGVVFNGKKYYDDFSPVELLVLPPAPPGRLAFYDGARWVYVFASGGNLDPSYRWAADPGDEDHPADASGWAPAGGDGFTAPTGTPEFGSDIGPFPLRAPVQAAANGSGSSPTAPVQVAANGTGSTPAAPPVVVG